jgi:hypothetical protein
MISLFFKGLCGEDDLSAGEKRKPGISREEEGVLQDKSEDMFRIGCIFSYLISFRS